LIVSDQADFGLLWMKAFQEKGYTIVCERPENALQTCRLIAPAVIVVDTHLHHEKRLVFCSELRAITSNPILLLVPEYDSNEMVDCYSIGVDECLLKPVNPTFLVVKAVSWLLRRRWLEYDLSLKEVHTSI
jgi:DNA-binding response OmpR family regulator